MERRSIGGLFMRLVAVGLIASLLGGNRSFAASPTKIWVNNETSPAVKAYYPTYGAEDSIAIYQSSFDPDDDAKFDVDALVYWVQTYVPEGYDKPLVMDWEGNWMAALFSNSGPAFNDAMAEGIALLNLLKTLRPNAPCGFYAVPLRIYYPLPGMTTEETWHHYNDPLVPLMEASGALYPSLYDIYRNPQDVDQQDDLAYVALNVTSTLAMGYTLGLATYPYVMYRWHGSGNMCVAGRLIDEPEFHNHIQAIFDAQYAGTHVDGIVWWGADNGFYNESLLPAPDQPNCQLHNWSQVARATLSDEIPFNPNHPNPNYPNGYMDWEFYRDSLMLRRLAMMSNIAYATDYALPVTIELEPKADVTVNSGPFSHPDLIVGETQNLKFRSLMDWGNMITQGVPAGSTIVSSRLTLRCLAAAASAKPFSCHPMIQKGWTESQANWTLFKTDKFWQNPGGDFHPVNGVTSGLTLPTTQGLKSYDISPTLQWLLDNSNGKADFMLKRNNESSADAVAAFDPSESGTEPWLVLTIIPP